MQDVGTILKELRLGRRIPPNSAKPLSQAELSAIICVSQPAISQWENGHIQSLKPENQRALSKVYLVDIPDLLKHSEDDVYELKPWVEDRAPNPEEGRHWLKGVEPMKFNWTMPPGIIDEHELEYVQGTHHIPDLDHFAFPTKEMFQFLMLKESIGDLAAERMWPLASAEDRYAEIMSYNFRMNNGAKYGHGEEYWKKEMPFLIGRFPEYPSEMPDSSFARYINAYMASKTEQSIGGMAQMPYTLYEIIFELQRIEHDKNDDGWLEIGKHLYKPEFYYNYVCGRRIDQYELSTADEEFVGLSTVLKQTFRTDAYGYNLWMPMRLFDVREETEYEPKKKMFSGKYKDGDLVKKKIYIKPTDIGMALLEWADENFTVWHA